MNTKYSIRGALVVALWIVLIGCQQPKAPSSPAQMFVRQHTACPTVAYLNPIWSSDGASIIYTVGTPSLDIRQVNLDGTGDELLATGAFLPALSPDGSLLMFLRNTGPARPLDDLYVLNMATRQARVVVLGTRVAAWSPDSAYVVHTTAPSLGGSINLTDIASGETLPLTGTPPNGAIQDAYPLMSPDGGWVAFESNEDGPFAAYLVSSINGGDPLPLSLPEDDFCPVPGGVAAGVQAWRPDSGAVAVSRECNANRDTLLYGTDGRLVAEWPDVEAKKHSLAWSPDGASLLFITEEGAAQHLIVAGGDASDPHIVRENVSAPAWSPDGTQIVFIERGADGLLNVVVIAADGSNARQVTHNPNTGKVCWH